MFTLVPNDYKSLFFDMLFTLSEKAIHQCCVNVLLTEVYKYLDGLSLELLNEVFYLRQNRYDLNILDVF